MSEGNDFGLFTLGRVPRPAPHGGGGGGNYPLAKVGTQLPPGQSWIRHWLLSQGSVRECFLTLREIEGTREGGGLLADWPDGAGGSKLPFF